MHPGGRSAAHPAVTYLFRSDAGPNVSWGSRLPPYGSPGGSGARAPLPLSSLGTANRGGDGRVSCRATSAVIMRHRDHLRGNSPSLSYSRQQNDRTTMRSS